MTNESIGDEFFRTPLTADWTLRRYRGCWFATNKPFIYPSDQNFKGVEEFSLNDDDVLIASYPKSGTSWLMYAVWLIKNGCYSDEGDSYITDKVPFLDMMAHGLDGLANRPSPRLIKTHFLYNMLPRSVRGGRGKVIYITRNPKDVCVSCYHFHRDVKFIDYKGTFPAFFDMFVTGNVVYGSFPDHVSQYWEHRDDDNVLFVQYEDLQRNAAEVIRIMAAFVNKSLIDDEVSEIVRKTSFNVMKENRLANFSVFNDIGLLKKGIPFMRKGVVGDWVNLVTPDMESIIEDQMVQPLRALGMSFVDRLP